MVSHPLRIIYAGTPEFSVCALQALIDSSCEIVAVYTQPDRPAGRGRGLQSSPVKEKALEYGIPVFQPESLKQDEAQAELKSLDADLMVVTAYGLLLPPVVLKTPRLGCINIHASLLPRWRGAAPIQRAILAGDKKTGITIMQMDEGLDTGDMLAVAECDITDDDTGSSLHDSLMQLGAQTLLSVLPAIADQSQQAVAQDDSQACYASKLTKSEAEINWQVSAVEIQRAIRAYNAWPVAHCRYQKKNRPTMLRIWQAEVISDPEVLSLAVNKAKQDAAPGTVLAESAAGIDVLTGAGILRITQLQPEGKRKMSVTDFLNANSLVGQILS